MLIIRKSPVDGLRYSMMLDITQEQIDAFDNGEYIQKAMKNLSPGQREFYLTGITPRQWNELFPVEEE